MAAPLTVAAKVDLVKAALELDQALSVRDALDSANEQLQLPSQGACLPA